MNKQGEWSLSPAFDITYSYDPTGKWTKSHQINLNGKNSNFTRNDIIEFGQFCSIKSNKAIAILEDIKNSFLDFENLADKYKVSEDLKNTVMKNLRLSL